MTHTMTYNDILKKHIDVMGENLGKYYCILCDEFSMLYLHWNEYVELYGKDERRVERLNKAAPGFFHMVQNQQFESCMLHLARLTDPQKSAGKANLTIRVLPDLVSDDSLRAKLADLIVKVEQKSEFCRDWRNRHFAHRDLLLALRDDRATPLAAATLENFSGALAVISDLLNAIENHYHNAYCSFENVIPHKGVTSLCHIIGLGLAALDWNRRQVEEGDLTSMIRVDHS